MRFYTRVDVLASCAGRDPGDMRGLPGEGSGGVEPYSAQGEGTLKSQKPPKREQPLWDRAEPLRRGPASGSAYWAFLPTGYSGEQEESMQEDGADFTKQPPSFP